MTPTPAAGVGVLTRWSTLRQPALRNVASCGIGGGWALFILAIAVSSGRNRESVAWRPAAAATAAADGLKGLAVGNGVLRMVGLRSIASKRIRFGLSFTRRLRCLIGGRGRRPAAPTPTAAARLAIMRRRTRGIAALWAVLGRGARPACARRAAVSTLRRRIAWRIVGRMRHYSVSSIDDKIFCDGSTSGLGRAITSQENHL